MTVNFKLEKMEKELVMSIFKVWALRGDTGSNHEDLNDNKLDLNLGPSEYEAIAITLHTAQKDKPTYQQNVCQICANK
jgi:hypothetical protein